ncbi:MAG: Zn-dependent alcohol dehydrogenase, partial [Methylomonas sp.]|nr:Zn-dependent alcohol dehydrogenase [Methylomonas sp.]
STFAASEPVDLSKVVVGELNILGSRCGPFDEALALLRQGSIPLASMVDARYSLKDGLAALRHAAQPGVRKILLQP